MTAEEWAKKLSGCTGFADHFNFVGAIDIVKAIQLDSRKQGYTEAADLFGGSPWTSLSRAEARQNILAARDRLKEGQ